MNLTRIADLALRFGRVDRATLHPDGIRAESDTDHTVMLGLIALHVASTHPTLGLDPGRLAALALVHDLPDAHAGDTNTTGGLTPEAQAAKEAREKAATEQIRADLGDTPVVWWLDAYERQECPEARFLRYLDKILPKLTHISNRNAAIRRTGHDADWLAARHKEQGDKLRAAYPEFADVLGPMFDAACAESEAALRGPALGDGREVTE